MQGLLSFSMKEMGKYTSVQIKLSKAIIAALVGVLGTKLIYMFNLGLTITADTYNEQKSNLIAMGYSLDPINDGKNYQFQLWGSIDFEIMALALNFLLLKYYIQQTDNLKRNEPYQYIHHSVFLGQYKKLQHLFFFAAVVDAFFAQTLIQLTILGKIFPSFLFNTNMNSD